MDNEIGEDLQIYKNEEDFALDDNLPEQDSLNKDEKEPHKDLYLNYGKFSQNENVQDIEKEDQLMDPYFANIALTEEKNEKSNYTNKRSTRPIQGKNKDNKIGEMKNEAKKGIGKQLDKKKEKEEIEIISKYTKLETEEINLDPYSLNLKNKIKPKSGAIPENHLLNLKQNSALIINEAQNANQSKNLI